MAISKVVYGNTTLIDLTGDTVASEKMLQGTTAHASNGDAVTGTIITKTSSGYNYIDTVSTDLQSELLAANFYRIPDKVQEILRTESGKYKFASNETMLMRAIERINNPIKLLPFAKQANVNVVNSFFNNLKTINVDSKITKEDLRWQVMEFAVQRNTDDRL